MPELHSNGVYENYIAQLFNPLSNLSQTNPAAFNSGFAGAGISGMVNPALANIGGQTQNPFLGQHHHLHSQVTAQTQAQTHAVIQLAQQVLVRQTAQAIQCAQALQAVSQLVQSLAAQQGQQGQQQGFGLGNAGFGMPQFGTQNPVQAIAQYLNPQQGQYHFGLAA